jgi:putative hemolysin
MTTLAPALPRVTVTRPTYRLRLAVTEADLRAAQRLRFAVFNLELGEGLAASYSSGRDEDAYDAFCDHLLVEHEATGEIVGTYRLQTGALAAAHLGYYSEQEFDFAPYEPLRCELVELGRACVHRDHRHVGVLGLLWRGIAQYACERRMRYLIGCSSLTSQDPRLASATYAYFARRDLLAPATLCTVPTAAFVCPPADAPADCPPPPKLLRTYLSVGARVCGPPAIDREFGTIDFLTLLDLNELTPAAKSHFGL